MDYNIDQYPKYFLAKKVNSQNKFPATGGGPKPPSPSPIDEAMMSLLAGKPSLEGIDGGFETSRQIISGKWNKSTKCIKYYGNSLNFIAFHVLTCT